MVVAISDLIRRKAVIPATLTSGAKYAYLVKWWNYPLEQSTWYVSLVFLPAHLEPVMLWTKMKRSEDSRSSSAKEEERKTEREKGRLMK